MSVALGRIEMKIRIEQYEQAADEKVSIGGIKWLKKWDVCVQCDSLAEAETLRSRLAEPEQEPVAWMVTFRRSTGLDTLIVRSRERAELEVESSLIVSVGPLYTAPPQREWVGLTDEEINTIAATPAAIPGSYVYSFARAIEAKLKEKNS